MTQDNFNVKGDCYHCGRKNLGETGLLVKGPFTNEKTLKTEVTVLSFCTTQCILMYLLDDLISSPFATHVLKEHEGWKPVLKQLHDELLKS